MDFAAISGWESTSIENHSGIVDILRNFKGDPDLIASSLQPLRPVAKQHALSYRVGERATFDLFLLNETRKTPRGGLRLEWIDPRQKRTELGRWEVPAAVPDCFSYSFVCRLAKGRVLVHRRPEFAGPRQAQWLANALSFLAS